MMKVVRFGAGKEGQVIAGVGIQRGEYGQCKPQPSRGHVTTHQEYAQKRRQQIAEYVLNRMAIDGRDRYGCGPLMMLLVYELVDVLVVEQTVRVVEAQLLHQYAYG